MEQSPSWEANRSSAIQEIPRILRDLKDQYHIKRARHFYLGIRIAPKCTTLSPYFPWTALLKPQSHEMPQNLYELRGY
jgi:hypothetical protein